MDKLFLIRMAAIAGASVLVFLVWLPFFIPASFFAFVGAAFGYCILWKQSRPYDEASLPNGMIRGRINNSFRKTRRLAIYWLAGALVFSLFAWSGGTSGNFASRAIGSFALALSVYVMLYMAANAATMKKLRLDVKGRIAEENNARKP